ncbi:MAG: hypothetical protein I8H67_08980 [Comamonadaceae bacterium]|nr:hypothetical protein [Comamonadaceae bacterium]
MFDSPTLSVSELAERWKKTPRQILDYAQALGVPLYFMFDGLAFDVSDEWLRFNGDFFESRELETLREGIASNESWILRSVRGQNGKFEQPLDSEGIRELRTRIDADKEECKRICERLAKREIDRKKMTYRGLMRPAPLTLLEIQRDGTAPSPHKAFHPQMPVKVMMLPGRGFDGSAPILDGRLLALEWFTARALTIDSLCAVTAEVKAIEAYLKAHQAAPVESDSKTDSPAPVADSASTAHEMPMKKAALITALEYEWPSIEADLSEAARNGLKNAAHAGTHGDWDKAKARAWAVSKGKIKQAAPALHPAIWPGTVTRNRN